MTQAVIVTGGSRGIGAATSLLAAQAGYAVGVNYVQDRGSALELVAQIEVGGGRAHALQADVSLEADVQRMFEEATAQLGSVSALVCNAGTTGRLTRLEDVDLATLRRVLDVNLLGCMLCCREAVRRMSTERGGTGGAIVNVSSVAASTGSAGEYVHYAASKAGVDAFTFGLAREVASCGIRVNAVSPGSTLTGIHAAAGDPQRPLRIAPRIPLQRLAEPQEIARAIVWLLSAEASYATGAVLRVAGGL